MNFERIRFLRERIGLSQRELAKKLNLTKSTISRWETGEKVIPLKHFITLCNMAQTSLDFGLGLNKDKTRVLEKRKLDAKVIGKHLYELREEKHITQQNLAKVLNTTQSTISSYENGKTTILTAFLYAICIHYKVSADSICDKK